MAPVKAIALKIAKRQPLPRPVEAFQRRHMRVEMRHCVLDRGEYENAGKRVRHRLRQPFFAVIRALYDIFAPGSIRTRLCRAVA